MQPNSEKKLSVRSIHKGFDDFISCISERGEKPKLPTGIGDLDDLIWGLHKGELLVIAARPSHGKTSLSLQIALNLAKQNIKVIFLSMEMSQVSIIERLFCNEMMVHGWDLRRGVGLEQAKIDIDKFRSRLLTYPLEVFDNCGRSIKEVEEIISTYKPDVLFVDHIQRIHSKGYSAKHEALAAYVSSLKEFSIKYNCSIVANSQINRMGAKEGFAIDYMKGSGEIEEAGDTILQCNWLVRDDPMAGKNDYKVTVLKQRSGIIDQKIIKFEPQYYRFLNGDVYERTSTYSRSSKDSFRAGE